MTAIVPMIAASMLRFLDPATSVYMTDNPAEGEKLSREEGFFKYPNGLADPINATPRMMYVSFRMGNGERGMGNGEVTPLIKVNQVGYAIEGKKFAFLGGWLGPKYGAWKPRAGVSAWRVVDSASGEIVLSGELGSPYPFDSLIGEETFPIDFSSVTNQGTYFVEIPGVGRSAEFKITSSAAEDAFRVHMSGLYHQRCGIAKTADCTKWTSPDCHKEVFHGIFPPEEGTLEPKVRYFNLVRDTTDWRDESMHLPGGWHDAADFDRRPAHLSIVNDLAAVYLMRPENFRDGQLAIPECSNGIPDILDEAEWGLRHLLAAQQNNGGVGTWIETTRHPVPGEKAQSGDLKYAISRATRTSSMMFAAHAALLAQTHTAFRERYAKAAKAAWNFAMSRRFAEEVFYETKEPRRFMPDKVIEVTWNEDKHIPSVWTVKAALGLFALTGERRYLHMAEDAAERFRKEAMKDDWRMTPLMFSGETTLIPKEKLTPKLSELIEWWNGRIKTRADRICTAVEKNPYRNPASGAPRSWGESHPLRLARWLVAAHGATGEAKYLDAAWAAMDFHNGLNPNGTTLTSGLGTVYPVSFLHLTSYVDGIAEYIPGITPYRWTAKLPRNVAELGYGGDASAAEAWPEWRRYENFENQTVAASEFTVWETIAPAAAVSGYLISADAQERVPPLREPAKRIEALPGYWSLP